MWGGNLRRDWQRHQEQNKKPSRLGRQTVGLSEAQCLWRYLASGTRLTIRSPVSDADGNFGNGMKCDLNLPTTVIIVSLPAKVVSSITNSRARGGQLDTSRPPLPQSQEIAGNRILGLIFRERENTAPIWPAGSSVSLLSGHRQGFRGQSKPQKDTLSPPANVTILPMPV